MPDLVADLEVLVDKGNKLRARHCLHADDRKFIAQRPLRSTGRNEIHVVSSRSPAV